MKNINFDVDIDVADRDKILENLPHFSASIKRKTGFEKHNTGVYFQNMPFDPVNGTSNVDHNEAEKLGYFKVDFLNLHIYENIKSESHLEQLMGETQWDFLQYESVVEKLLHISNYSWLMQSLKPTSVDELAMCLAVIRPAKRYLTNCDWDKIKKEVWIPPKDGSFYFKKAHAISYAMAIVVQLNLMIEELLNQPS